MKWAAAFPELPFRRLFEPVARPVPPGASIVTAYSNGDVTLRSNRRTDGYHEAHDLSGYQGVEAGDFVVHGLDILRGSVGVSDSAGAISPVCTVCRPRRDIDPRFIAYAIRSQAYTGFTRAMARGIREGGADFRRWETLGELPVPAPPVPVQRAIADYLDAETARIDQLVAARRHQVDLLVARRTALISRRVEIGQLTPVRRVISLCTSGPRGWGDFVTDAGTMFIRSANLARTSIRISSAQMAYVPPQSSAEAARSRVRSGDVLVGITGANTGWVGLAGKEHEGAFVSQHVAILRPDGVLPEWLAYSVAADRCQRSLLASQYGGTKTQLGLEDLRELVIRVPTLDEQVAAMAVLSKAEVDNLAILEALDRAIDLLTERRQGVATSAVTGQLKFPGVVA